MSLLTSRASHLSAGIASHALLTIMFKDVPLLFWLIPFCRILINSLNYLGKRQESLIQTLWKQKIIKNIVTNSIRICNKINFKYSVDGILHYFANHINNHQEWHGYEVKNLSNKHMFRYTSGISQILLNSHLEFLPIQSNSNVVQTNNQNIGEAQI